MQIWTLKEIELILRLLNKQDNYFYNDNKAIF